MKHAFAVLALALVLVFAFGSVASAGIIRGEDYDNPGHGGGGNDEDHPWGGDQIIGGGGTVDDKYTRTSSLTGNLIIDLLLDRFIGTFYRGGTGTTATTSGNQSRLILNEREDEFRQGAASAISTRTRAWEVEKR